MNKWIWILLIFPLFANAAYQRNQARPVNEVVFGTVDTVRYISQQDIVHSKANGWGNPAWCRRRWFDWPSVR